MRYRDKNALIEEFIKRSTLFINEYATIAEEEKNNLAEGVDRSPWQMIAYCLVWMERLMQWDQNERQGVLENSLEHKDMKGITGLDREICYDPYQSYSLEDLKRRFEKTVRDFAAWISCLTWEELFIQGKRNWTAIGAIQLPVGEWIEEKTMIVFRAFRGEIRKWKKRRGAQAALL